MAVELEFGLEENHKASGGESKKKTVAAVSVRV
jgi:hypothetical protein